ncbi:hypothetical protein [Microvirga sp. P5_D2]
MLTNEMIADSSWREELNKRFGWMGGEHGLYFECMGGWRFILKDFFERVEATLVTPEEREGFRISQIKEKFGSARVHFHGGDDRIDRLVAAAEAASEITCDVCGGRGRLQGKGWLSTRCEAHTDWKG